MAEILRLSIDRMDSPIGELDVVADAEGRLRAIEWADSPEILLRALRLQYGERGFALEPARDRGVLTAAISRYFEGDLSIIDGLRVATGGTPFQEAVWAALRGIPCGTTTTYSELARRIGRPAAVRAVGVANGANPVPIVVPCHRVVGSDGTLTGYGGGLERKRWLLSHEAAAKKLPLLALHP